MHALFVLKETLLVPVQDVQLVAVFMQVKH